MRHPALSPPRLRSRSPTNRSATALWSRRRIARTLVMAWRSCRLGRRARRAACDGYRRPPPSSSPPRPAPSGSANAPLARSSRSFDPQSGACPRGCRTSRSGRSSGNRRRPQTRSKRLRARLEANRSRRNESADRRPDLCDSPHKTVPCRSEPSGPRSLRPGPRRRSRPVRIPDSSGCGRKTAFGFFVAAGVSGGRRDACWVWSIADTPRARSVAGRRRCRRWRRWSAVFAMWLLSR